MPFGRKSDHSRVGKPLLTIPCLVSLCSTIDGEGLSCCSLAKSAWTGLKRWASHRTKDCAASNTGGADPGVGTVRASRPGGQGQRSLTEGTGLVRIGKRPRERAKGQGGPRKCSPTEPTRLSDRVFSLTYSITLHPHPVCHTTDPGLSRLSQSVREAGEVFRR